MTNQKRAEQPKNLDFYLALPYTITLTPDEEGDIIAAVAELPGCMTHASTWKDALDSILEVRKVWIEMALEANADIPEPRKDAAEQRGEARGKEMREALEVVEAYMSASPYATDCDDELRIVRAALLHTSKP